MNQNEIVAHALGIGQDQYVGNNDYLVGTAAYGAAPGSDGKTSLGILSLLILGLMGFYVLTHTKQA